MKNITTMLQKGNLTPKERILLLVHDRVNEDLIGKKVLTEADKHALTEGWRPDNNEQVREYNLYHKGWQLEGGAGLDCQTAYLNAQIVMLKTCWLTDGIMCESYERKSSIFKGKDLGVDDIKALNFITQNSGLKFDRTIYGYAFYNLSEDVRQDILTLCPDAETESQYLDQEEIISDLFDGKNQLTTEAKEKLTDIILGVMNNKYYKIIKDKGLKYNEWSFDGYFAELPTIEIAKKWADRNAVKYDAKDEMLRDDLYEKMKDYAEKNGTTMREILRETISRWINGGLFVNDCSPIWNSDTKQTCNNADTKLIHKEVFKQWLVAKNEAKAMVQKLVDDGRLQVENREIDFFETKETIRIITGESLYNLDDDFVFASDYKKQADDLIPLGRLVEYVRRQGLFEYYASLLAFVDMYKKLSKIYEIELGYKIDNFINSFKGTARLLNRELSRAIEKLTMAIYQKHNIKFLIEITDEMPIDLESINPGTGETETHYLKEFRELFGGDFQ